MVNRIKPKQKKIMLSEKKAAALDVYLKSNNIKLQDFLESYIDKQLEKDKENLKNTLIECEEKK